MVDNRDTKRIQYDQLEISWSEEKNAILKKTRGISFEQIERMFWGCEAGRLIDVIPNPSHKHPGQAMGIVQIDDEIWVVPFVRTTNGIELKTAYPSRKYRKIYGGSVDG